MALDVSDVRVAVVMSFLLTLWRKGRCENLRGLLLRLIRKLEFIKICVGNPLLVSEDLSPWEAKVQEFAENLPNRSGL